VDPATSLAPTTTDQPSATTANRKAPQTTAGAGSTAISTSIKGASSTTGRQGSSATTTGSPTTRPRSSTTKPTATTKPEVKPKLTVIIDDIVNANGEVRVSPGGQCTSTCSYSFSKGTSITLAVTHGVEVFTGWDVTGPGGGQTTCVEAVSSCSLTLNDDATVTANFGA
jgi:hypothetical protein